MGEIVSTSEGISPHNIIYIMTTSYVIETVDQELQLSDLQNINGAALPVLAAWGTGVATGAMANSLYDNRE